MEINRDLLEMVREAVVNAIIHRDYAIEGAKCQLVITENTIRVMSPGRPVEPITLDQLRTFNAPMLSRNPVLHYIFSQMGLAEERGLGLTSLRKCAEDARLPLPQYKWESPYLTLTIYRNGEALASEVAGPAAMERLTGDKKAAWDIISIYGSTTTRELMERTGIEERKAQRILRSLGDSGLLRRVGKGRATRYELAPV